RSPEPSPTSIPPPTRSDPRSGWVSTPREWPRASARCGSPTPADPSTAWTRSHRVPPPSRWVRRSPPSRWTRRPGPFGSPWAAAPSFRQRFVRRSAAAASIEHPNIVPIYQAGEADGVLFIAMRYVEGTDLRALLDRDGPLPAERAISIVSQVAQALDAAHEVG